MKPVELKTGGYTPSADDPPYLRLGGPDGVRALAEAFYDAMEAHEPALTAVHQLDAPGKVSKETRTHFGTFLVFWLGGPQDYLTTRGHPRLRMRHGHVKVDEAMRDAWLRSMGRAMDARGVTGEVRAYLNGRFADVADFLRNVERPAP
ncbi:MAG: cyanoglobin [Archangium sp.]|nr:cyanoglobin [Archangium sp.]